jgi:hypothetical protein
MFVLTICKFMMVHLAALLCREEGVRLRCRIMFAKRGFDCGLRGRPSKLLNDEEMFPSIAEADNHFVSYTHLNME